MSDVLHRLADALRADGGLLAGAVVDPAPGEPARHGALAASGPRAAGHEAEYELLVEAIREGYLLHYATGRVVSSKDPDLALLAGDRLYALGLARLSALGDVPAVLCSPRSSPSPPRRTPPRGPMRPTRCGRPARAASATAAPRRTCGRPRYTRHKAT